MTIIENVYKPFLLHVRWILCIIFFIFILPSVQRRSVKRSTNKSTKKKPGLVHVHLHVIIYVIPFKEYHPTIETKR